jgi:signal transduction histidine kinase/sarcosine oxidase delta subunit
MLWAWVLLFLGLALTTWAWHSAKTDAAEDARARFAFRKAEIIGAIHSRMAAYEQVLRGALGLFSTVGELTRDRWATYVQTLHIEQHYPGIQGIGYSKWIPPAVKEAYIAQIRAEGFPTFTIRPEGQRDEYTAITYLEPFDRRNQQAFGYDMWAHAVRRAAMQAARDTATTRISGKVTLVQEIDADVQAGFLMYLPYYGHGGVPPTVEERRAALVGFVYSPFRMRDLMEGILGRALPDLRLEIFDGTEISTETSMYDSESAAPLSTASKYPGLTDIATLDIYGHTWMARLTTLPLFGAALGKDRPLIILVSGSLISFLFFGVLWSFAGTRARAEALAQGMTKTLDHHVQALARSNAELEQFAYVASHDLQEPLRAVAGCVQLLQQRYQGRLDARADELIAHAVEGATRMQALINDLLTYSRVDRRGEPLQPTDCAEILAEVLADLQVALKEGGVIVTHEALPTVLADPLHMRQLFQNLLGNAIKYRSRERPPAIHVGAKYQAGEWRFAVRDNGIGIEPQYRARIFAIFQRLHTRREYPGTGIGLAICKKIVERYGGRIWVESEPGRGSTFFFTIPDRR